MAAVPRIYEKVTPVAQTALSEGRAKAKIFTWAFKVGIEAAAEKELNGEKVGGTLAMKRNIADKLVFSKIRERLGGRMRYMISGSAALNKDIALWFYAAGSEDPRGLRSHRDQRGHLSCVPTGSSSARWVNPPRGPRSRSPATGNPDPWAGRHARLPEPAGRERRGVPGRWFATGDIGEIDDMGRVKITDRKKDLVKTSRVASTSPVGDREPVQGDQRTGGQHGRSRKRPQLRQRADHAGPGRGSGMGGRARQGRRLAVRHQQGPGVGQGSRPPSMS